MKSQIDLKNDKIAQLSIENKDLISNKTTLLNKNTSILADNKNLNKDNILLKEYKDEKDTLYDQLLNS